MVTLNPGNSLFCRCCYLRLNKVRPQECVVVSGIGQIESEVHSAEVLFQFFFAEFKYRSFARCPYFEDVAQFVITRHGYSPCLYVPVHACAEGYAGGFIGLRLGGFVLAARGHQPHEGDDPKVKMILFHVLSNFIF